MGGGTVLVVIAHLLRISWWGGEAGAQMSLGCEVPIPRMQLIRLHQLSPRLLNRIWCHLTRPLSPLAGSGQCSSGALGNSGVPPEQ